MVKRLIQLFGMAAGGMAGDFVHGLINAGTVWTDAAFGAMRQSGAYYTHVGLGALCGLAVATIFAGAAIRRMHEGAEWAASHPTGDLAAGSFGLMAGLAVSALLSPAVAGLSGAGVMVPAALTLFFGYMGLRIGLGKKEELAAAAESFW
ncbi:hypothetical protein BG52_10615, partial [Paenibacillus darwinianus]